jgi:hypothetical protein
MYELLNVFKVGWGTRYERMTMLVESKMIWGEWQCSILHTMPKFAWEGTQIFKGKTSASITGFWLGFKPGTSRITSMCYRCELSRGIFMHPTRRVSRCIVYYKKLNTGRFEMGCPESRTTGNLNVNVLLVSVITKFQFSVPGGNTGLCHSNYPAA